MSFIIGFDCDDPSAFDAQRHFLEDARIPLDNNASERALRCVALGRKNFLFVGDIESGRNLAGLYSLVATCEARAINPFEYLLAIATQPDAVKLVPQAWLPWNYPKSAMTSDTS